MTDAETPRVFAWNVVVTCRPGGQRLVRRALHPVIRLRRSGFRNVLVGRAQETEPVLTGVADLLERRRSLHAALGKLLPVERTFVIDLSRFDDQLAAEAARVVDRLAGQSFHVRVERRGHKGTINTQATEKALGDSLFAALEARGAPPRVTFTDPDVVVAVELIGDVGGVTVVTREMRRRFPFVRVD